MKYKRLVAEMLVDDITDKDLSELLGSSIENINNKINGTYDFTLGEVGLIMETYFKDKSTDYIFE